MLETRSHQALLSSNEVRGMVLLGIRDFISTIHCRRVHIVAYDMDCGCTGYAQIYDADGEDWEFLDSIDLSCMAECV
jgi:hypothetical protein